MIISIQMNKVIQNIFNFKQKQHTFNEYYKIGLLNPSAFSSEDGYWKFMEYIGDNCKYNLKIIEPIFYGNWTGEKSALIGQDIVLATKT